MDEQTVNCTAKSGDVCCMLSHGHESSHAGLCGDGLVQWDGDAPAVGGMPKNWRGYDWKAIERVFSARFMVNPHLKDGRIWCEMQDRTLAHRDHWLWGDDSEEEREEKLRREDVFIGTGDHLTDDDKLVEVEVAVAVEVSELAVGTRYAPFRMMASAEIAARDPIALKPSVLGWTTKYGDTRDAPVGIIARREWRRAGDVKDSNGDSFRGIDRQVEKDEFSGKAVYLMRVSEAQPGELVADCCAGETPCGSMKDGVKMRPSMAMDSFSWREKERANAKSWCLVIREENAQDQVRTEAILAKS